MEQQLDFTLPLHPSGSGTYRAGFAAPVPGVWNVHLTVRQAGELYVADERVVLR